MKKTKIIATMGPACRQKSILAKMFNSRLHILRLNFSHDTHKNHISTIKLINKLNNTLNKNVKIMQDLEGFRIRTAKLNKPLNLKKSRIINIAGNLSKKNKKPFIPIDYNHSFEAIKEGCLIYIDDGKICLKVLESKKDILKTEVISPGILKEHKGINIPDLEVDFPPLTEKDKKDLKIAFKYNLDYIAQSFVRNADDILYLKNYLKKRLKKCKILAKIESRQALKNLDDIIEVSDGIIIARGDLGISVPIYKIPVIQKQIIKKCAQKNKPVTVATQMLENMVEENIPTRAEVSDVANAIIDQADCLLLSAETAIGHNPAQVINMMNKVIKYTENYLKDKKEKKWLI